jgi:Protein of unknown function (DUF4012)
LPALLLIVLLLGGAGGFTYMQARGLEDAVVASFHSAQSHVERGKALLKQANQKHDAALIPRARNEFNAAVDDFRRARRAVDGNQLAQAASRLPLASRPVGSRLHAVDAIADIGVWIAQAALRAADVDQLFVSKPAGGAPSGTARLLGIVHDAQPALIATRTDLENARSIARAVDASVLPGAQEQTFATVKQTIDKGLAGLDEFQRLVPVMSDILGADGPRTYLVEQTNPFELRAGGGYIGTYSLLTADHGELKVSQGGDTHTLPEFTATEGGKAYVPPPKTLTEFLTNKSWNLGDSNFFPDFESNAKAAMSFSQTDFNQKIDGVISLDLYAVQALLKLTGPITLPGTSVTVDSDNLLYQLILLDIQDPNHKQVLGAVTQPLMSKITGLGPDHWSQLLDVLNQQASQRHIQVYFTNGGSQAEVQRLGWSGSLAFSPQDDFLFPVESNFGGNKDNYFLRREYTVDLTRTPTGLHHKVQMGLSLDLSKAPAGYIKPYRAYYRLFVPAGASNPSMGGLKGDDHPYTDVPPGTRVIDGWQQINPDARGRGSIQVTFEYDTPWTVDSSGRHVIYWQKQPGTLVDKVTLHWNNAGQTTDSLFYLGMDQVILLGQSRVDTKTGQTAQAQLPKLSF